VIIYNKVTIKQEDENEEEAVIAVVFFYVGSAFVRADQNRIARYVFGVS
jgi:Uri superfamily endonuclease